MLTVGSFYSAALEQWQAVAKHDHAATLAALAHRTGSWPPPGVVPAYAAAPPRAETRAPAAPGMATERASVGIADVRSAAYFSALFAPAGAGGAPGGEEGLGGGLRPEMLVRRLAAVPAALRLELPGGSEADSARKLADLWAMAASLVDAAAQAAEAERAPALRAGDEGAWRARSPELLRALLCGAVGRLGAQFKEMAEQRVAAHAAEAARGGLPGWEHTAAAHVRARLLAASIGASELRAAAESGAPCCEMAELGGGAGGGSAGAVPLWAVLFACARAGQWAAASRALESARAADARLHGCTEALSAALRALGSGLGGASDGPVGAELLGAVAAEFETHHGHAAAQPHSAPAGGAQAEGAALHAQLSGQLCEQCAVLYAHVSAAPLAAGAAGGGQRRWLGCVEDYLWHKLGLALATFDAHGHAAGGAALAQLQVLLSQTYGAAHFGAGAGGSALLYATVLTASLQFERGVAHLWAEAEPQLRTDGLHLALSLHRAGLLATDDSEAAPAGFGGGAGAGGLDSAGLLAGGLQVIVDPALAPGKAAGGGGVPALRLCALVELHARSLMAQSVVAALQYCGLLQAEGRRLSVSAELIVAHGQHLVSALCAQRRPARTERPAARALRCRAPPALRALMPWPRPLLPCPSVCVCCAAGAAGTTGERRRAGRRSLVPLGGRQAVARPRRRCFARGQGRGGRCGTRAVAPTSTRASHPTRCSRPMRCAARGSAPFLQPHPRTAAWLAPCSLAGRCCAGARAAGCARAVARHGHVRGCARRCAPHCARRRVWWRCRRRARGRGSGSRRRRPSCRCHVRARCRVLRRHTQGCERVGGAGGCRGGARVCGAAGDVPLLRGVWGG